MATSPVGASAAKNQVAKRLGAIGGGIQNEKCTRLAASSEIAASSWASRAAALRAAVIRSPELS